MNRTGQGACILPHGVLFRGNSEANIRKYILNRGYIKGIIGLPTNLFFGTGIPACIIVLDKTEAANRKGIFMIDAKTGFTKDGPKNRLREQDVRRIMDVWAAQKNVLHYARFVEMDEIIRNEYNLNIPRYIESVDTEIVQDIEAHLKVGLPVHDVDQMQYYWDACPELREALFMPHPTQKNYLALRCDKEDVRATVKQHPDFVAQDNNYKAHFNQWCNLVSPTLYNLSIGTKPKQLIQQLSDAILSGFANDTFLVDAYDVYEQLLTYWNETLQDDSYIIATDGWKAELYTPQPAAKKNKDGSYKTVKEKKAATPEDVVCDLLPVSVVIDNCFSELKMLIQTAEERIAENEAQLTELQEEEAENYLDPTNFSNSTLNDGNVRKRIKELNNKSKKEIKVLEHYLDLKAEIADAKRVLKVLKYELLTQLAEKYAQLTEAKIKALVVEKKWFATLATRLDDEMQRISQTLTANISDLAERYEQTLPAIDLNIRELKDKVKNHLSLMGFNW